MDNIEKIEAKKILNSRGEWTIETKIQFPGGVEGSASVPEGESTGSAEAVYVGSDQAIENLNTEISEKLEGNSYATLKEFDNILLELDGTKDKSRLGANTLLSLSVAYARGLAAFAGKELWSFLAEELGNNYCGGKPRIYANLINGGLHSGSGLAFQEYLVIPKSRDIKTAISEVREVYQLLGERLEEAFGSSAINLGDEGGFSPACEDEAVPLEIFSDVFGELGISDGVDMGLDVAGENLEMDKEEMMDIYESLVPKFNLFYLEDPFGEDDFESFSVLLGKVGESCVVVGDDLTVTNRERMKKAKDEKSVNGVIIKPNQIGTLTETLEAIRFARDNSWSVVVSHRSGETNDDFIADLAYGVGADGFKLGAPARGERIAKYNRLLEIDSEA